MIDLAPKFTTCLAAKAAMRRFLAATDARLMGRPLFLRPFRRTAAGTVVVPFEVAAGGAEVRVVLRLATDPARGSPLARGAVLQGTARKVLPPAEARVVPRTLWVEPLEEGRPQAAAVEERMPGTTGREWLAPLGFRDPEMYEALDAGMRFLEALHGATAVPSRLDAHAFHGFAGEFAARIEHALDAPDDRAALRAIVDSARAALTGRLVRLVLGHGDLHLDHLLYEDGRLSGVIGWERSRAFDLPALDAFHLLLGPARLRDGVDCGDAIATRLATGRLGEGPARLLARYLDALHVPHDLVPALSVVYWLRQAGGHARLEAGDRARTEESVARPLAALRTALGAGRRAA